MKYLGNTNYTTGLRTYKRIVVNGKKKFILLSWIQRQCIICGVFLDKRSKLYFLKCDIEIAYCRVGAFIFHNLAEVTDKFGYLVFGKEAWEKAKKEIKD